jgi:hypothetical protein
MQSLHLNLHVQRVRKLPLWATVSSVYDIVDFNMRGAHIQNAGVHGWLHCVMMLINICGSLVQNLLCHFSGI